MKENEFILYRYQDCDHEFYYKDETIASCPYCSITLIDDFTFVAQAWLLGVWFGFWEDN